MAVEGKSEAGVDGRWEVDYGRMADEIEALGRFFLKKYGASGSRRDGLPGGAEPAAITAFCRKNEQWVKSFILWDG